MLLAITRESIVGRIFIIFGRNITEKVSNRKMLYAACAKHYENPTMISRVTAKNVGDVFLRHSVVNCTEASELVKLQLCERGSAYH